MAVNYCRKCKHPESDHKDYRNGQCISLSPSNSVGQHNQDRYVSDASRCKCTGFAASRKGGNLA
jgi:hypothetical protein